MTEKELNEFINSQPMALHSILYEAIFKGMKLEINLAAKWIRENVGDKAAVDYLKAIES